MTPVKIAKLSLFLDSEWDNYNDLVHIVSL